MGALDNSEAFALLGQVAAGDRRAQQQLVNHLHRRVQSIALSILGNALDAEDTTQVILMEILKSAASFRGENFLAWSDRIAARTAIRHARQRRIRGLRFESSDHLDDFPLPSQAFDRDLPRDLMDYLSQLPETRRVAVVLRHVMDYSIEEIAELTECSPNTVKDRLLQGRGQLRRLIRRDKAIGVAGRLA